MADANSSISSRLRLAFLSGLTLPLAWRLRQLHSLLLLLQERESDLYHALSSDLGKSSYETYFSEIIYLKNSCVYARKNLKKWAAAQKVSSPVLTFPTTSEVVAEPLGVVLIIAPWNFPLTLALDPLLGAIAAGNAVVLKPSEVAPATSALLAKLLPQYLDQNAVCVVEGGIHECTALLEQKWDKIFFTGSSTVGRIVMTAATKHLTPVTLELGGKCPVIIDSTADLDVTVRRLTFSKWSTSYGQACIAPDYVLAEESIVQTLVAKLKTTLVDFYGEDASSSSDHARVVNLKHLARLRSLLEEESVSKTIVHGGELDEKERYMAPTILLNPLPESAVMKEEIFGPILPIIGVSCMDEAVKFVKARPKPLAVYVFTNNAAFKQKATVGLHAGAVVFNELVLQFAFDGLPFGGVGESGMGSYHGKYSFDTFSHPKTVVHRSFKPDLLVRYPPFTDYKKVIVRCLLDSNYLGAVLAWLGFKKKLQV